MNDTFIKEYYSNYDEDNRLDRPHQKIEFLTTVKYVEKYLKEGMRIAEIGAGTGRYSLYFAENGYQVDALELVEHNINIMRSKVKENHTITIQQGTALDLKYDDNTFDITMVLGPMYHVYNEEDRYKVISEALRITKPGGLVYFAYITHDAVIIEWGLQDGNFLKGVKQNMFTEDYKCISEEKDLFAMMHIQEFKDLLESHNVEELHVVGTDGVAPWFRQEFKDMDEETYNEWLKYHFKTCERQDLIGFSNHIVHIVKKI